MSDNKLSLRELKEQIRIINDEILKLEKLASKNEEDDMYDSDTYIKIEKLENERDNLQALANDNY